MLDRSGSMRANNSLVEAAGEAFVAKLLPADKARIGSFAARIQVDPRAFTSDQTELLRILRTELQPDGPTPLWNAVNVGMTALLRQEGRRVVLVFTDVDRPMTCTHNVSLGDAAAGRTSVMVYAIGWLAGIRMAADRTAARRRAERRLRRRALRPCQEPDKGWPNRSKPAAAIRADQHGRLQTTFAHVADELHAVCVGFVPAKLDNKTHSSRQPAWAYRTHAQIACRCGGPGAHG
jgi:hypothetical protein